MENSLSLLFTGTLYTPGTPEVKMMGASFLDMLFRYVSRTQKQKFMCLAHSELDEFNIS